jgi:putative membrane protein
MVAMAWQPVDGRMISDNDRTRIADAIRTAESRTSGEIFCVVAQRASAYALVPIAWAAALGLLVPWPLIYLTTWPASVIYVLQLIGAASAAALLWRPALRFRLVSRRTKHERAHSVAMEQFWKQQLQKTEWRTAVLIFASLAERYVEIVPDAGIAQKVPAEAWQGAAAALAAAVKDDRAGDGFVAAIEQCGAILAEQFPVIPDAVNPNELPDKLVEI